MTDKDEAPKEYLTKRILLSRTNKAFKDASEDAMNLVGYVVVAEDNWVVKKFKDGTTKRIKPLEDLDQPEKVIFD